MIDVLDPTHQSIIVLTDLDGTLLDHHTYRADEALIALSRLSKAGIPVIPVTSKTRPEVERIRESLALDTPFVVENGAAIFIPKIGLDNDWTLQAEQTQMSETSSYWVKAFAPPREHWAQLFAALKNEFPDSFTWFSDMGDEGVSKATGLDCNNARLANTRDYSEPVLWTGTSEQQALFISRVTAMGYKTVMGGRFLHVTTGYDKGKALLWLKEFFARQQAGGGHEGKPVVTVALGDSGNDLDMLEAADFAVVIRSPVQPYPTLSRKEGLIYSQNYGPAGWREGMARLFGWPS